MELKVGSLPGTEGLARGGVKKWYKNGTSLDSTTQAKGRMPPCPKEAKKSIGFHQEGLIK